MITVFLKILNLYQKCLREMFRFPWRKKEILQQTVQIGIGSLPVVLISTAFAGLVVTNEIAWHMNHALHSVSMIPGFTGQFIVRELGIAIPALLVVAKVGASIAAEVGTMKVTEQVDALKLLGIDPIRYLVFPRFIASTVSMACMTFFAIGITLAFAMTIAVWFYGFGLQEYINTLRHFLGLEDFLSALAKGVVFGSIIPVIACVYGLECKGGAEGVGTATTEAVVSSTIAVISLDFLLTYFFTSLTL